MTTYRIIVPQTGRVFVEYRSFFPWPRWRRLVRWVFTPFDFEPASLDFATVEEAREWIAPNQPGETGRG